MHQDNYSKHVITSGLDGYNSLLKLGWKHLDLTQNTVATESLPTLTAYESITELHSW